MSEPFEQLGNKFNPEEEEKLLHLKGRALMGEVGGPEDRPSAKEVRKNVQRDREDQKKLLQYGRVPGGSLSAALYRLILELYPALPLAMHEKYDGDGATVESELLIQNAFFVDIASALSRILAKPEVRALAMQEPDAVILGEKLEAEGRLEAGITKRAQARALLNRAWVRGSENTHELFGVTPLTDEELKNFLTPFVRDAFKNWF